jgi:hypothetical protein
METAPMAAEPKRFRRRWSGSRLVLTRIVIIG